MYRENTVLSPTAGGKPPKNSKTGRSDKIRTCVRVFALLLTPNQVGNQLPVTLRNLAGFGGLEPPLKD